MSNLRIHFILFLITSIVLSAFVAISLPVRAATASHLVISEVQLAGTNSTDDFIEIYNPTSSPVNLGDLRLVKRSGDNITNDSIVTFDSAESIAAHGYFLWCNSGLSATLTCDKTSGSIVSNNNSIALTTDPLDGGTVIDAVTFGTVDNTLGEGTSLTAPAANTSVERKANSSSDATSMETGGSDEFAGNGEDTDNNSNDFVNRALSNPQNSSSQTEPLAASPTPSSSPTASPSVEPSPSVSPSASPSASVSPTPSPSPSPSPSASPTASPSTSPSILPSISPEPSASSSPSPSTNPNMKIVGVFPFSKNPKICYLIYQPIKIAGINLFLPKLSCQAI